MVNELSLFSGAGGGLLGTKLLGWRTIGYVEFEPYCQKVIKARIDDGILDPAPIFGDIRKFISDGYAASYTGLVDVVTGGFPCQPFSVAGKQRGADDERNMWPATRDVVQIVKPRYVLLENVPGIRGYLPVVIRDLRQLGYDVRRPLQLGADDVGARHRRKRIWIRADSPSSGCINGGYLERRDGYLFPEERKTQEEEQSRRGRVYRPGQIYANNVANPPKQQDDRRERRIMDGTEECREGVNATVNLGGQDVADTYETGRGEQRRSEPISSEQCAPECHSERGWWQEDPADTICIHDNDAGHGTSQICRECGQAEICGLSRWGLESRLGRVANGVAHRVDRLKAIGNGQVSLCMAVAHEILSKEAD